MRIWNGCGLAAPQIGVGKRIFVMEVWRDVAGDSHICTVNQSGFRHVSDKATIQAMAGQLVLYFVSSIACISHYLMFPMCRKCIVSREDSAAHQTTAVIY
jgi:hypothetical protein